MLLRRYHDNKAEETFKDIKDKEVGLSDLKVDELKELAKEKDIEGYSKMKKEELIEALEG